MISLMVGSSVELHSSEYLATREELNTSLNDGDLFRGDSAATNAGNVRNENCAAF